MNPHTKTNASLFQLRFAVALHKALKKSSIPNYKILAKKAGIDPHQMQEIANGRTDVTLTTNLALSEALGISYSKFCSYYDSVKEKNSLAFFEYLRNLRVNDKYKLMLSVDN